MGIFDWMKRKTQVVYGPPITITIGNGTSLFDSMSDEAKAYALPTYTACVELIAGQIGAAALEVFNDTEKGMILNRSHALAKVFSGRANPDMTMVVAMETLMRDVLNHSNAYAFVERDAMMNVTGIYPIPPKQVTLCKTKDGYIVYKVPGKDIPIMPYYMLHVKGRGHDGYLGKSTLEVMETTINLGLSQLEFSDKY